MGTNKFKIRVQWAQKEINIWVQIKTEEKIGKCCKLKMGTN